MNARGAVAVLGDRRQGSGVLLTPDLVLTAEHVLGGRGVCDVAFPGHTRLFAGTAVWSDPGLDAALLHVSRGPEDWFGSLLRTVATDRPVPHCEILGFPQIQRYDHGGKLDLDQYTGTVLPMAGLIQRTMVFEFDRPPAVERPDGRSPLAGLSGAPVFAGDGLIGIVKEVPAGRGHRRVHCVPLGVLAKNPKFRQTYMVVTRLPLPDRLTGTTGAHPEDRVYAEEYAEALGAAYRRTRIFGLDDLGRRDAEWDLDTAYLSLEAASGDPAPQRVDDLLGSRPRVLLRGDAGAGKTTLVWWLAAHAAAGTLGPELGELNGLVPFVVPLRSLRARSGALPAPADLPGVARLPVDAPPDGWAGRVLKAGRGLLLVDGLDEVPQDDREAAHTWLCALLDRFPDTRCLATVRPLAVEPGWLEPAGFEELTLLPLRDADIRAFVAAWHRAARLDADPREDLDALERDLVQQFERNPTLADLARTPLLAAVICALHRLRQGFLPESRWALYDSALRMLLGTRDKRRSVSAPEGVTLSVEEHHQLLQRVAAWLVRGGQTEFTRDQALHQLTRALPGMPGVRDQGGPELILTHLLNRTGLLQERSDDVFQFTHRTFQDFLAAKEFVEDDNVKEMLGHAHDQQWHDVLLLAAGHCARRQLPVLVNGLLHAGDASRADRRTTLYVLAALCAQHAAWLDERTDARVRGAVRGLLPPGNAGRRSELARLGPYVLPLLPEPDDRLDRLDRQQRTLALIHEVGGREAVPYARRFATGGTPTWLFSSDWDRYPTREYAREVLDRLDLRHTPLRLTTRAQLAELPGLPGAGNLVVAGDFTADELAVALDGHAARRVRIENNRFLEGLGFLEACPCLEVLELHRCTALPSVAVPPGLGGLTSLTLASVRVSTAGLEALARLPRLQSLYVEQPVLEGDRLGLAPLCRLPDLAVHITGLPQNRISGHRLLSDRLIID
ncbi:NACHT domain-containing protein [Streptomyces sp. TRM64462]|uniref:NACHT domain-containing protein n=1 Tax=Streptomyces sp. TRM64462 TaxID=2741726 RepID=UPI002815787C|nr:NACHT domain-containing protein [Streptomyces sp. TRM64462]